MITFMIVTSVVMLGLGLVSYLSEKRVNTRKEASALSLLPGDIKYESLSGRFRFYFPITTSIIITIILTLVLNFLR
jgi:hypothetical protein